MMTAGAFAHLLHIHAESAASLQNQFEQVGIGPFHQEMKELKQELAYSIKLRDQLSKELSASMTEAVNARESVARLREHIRHLETVTRVHVHDDFEQLKKDYGEVIKANATLHTAFNESQKECADVKNRVRNISDAWKQLSGVL